MLVLPPSNSEVFPACVGMDISKSWFDVAILIPSRPLLLHHRFSNSKLGFSQLWQWLKASISQPSTHWLFCLESTGIYSRSLVHFLMGKSLHIWIASALDIKRSSGLQRGKNDQIDAKRIAQYCYLHQREKRLISLSKLNLEKLQDLQAARQRLIKSRKLLTIPIAELKGIDPKNAALLEKVNRDSLKGIEKSLKKSEELIEQIIKEDEQLNKNFELATSVPGVGKVLAIQLILATHGFTRLMNPRKLACHGGVAPFDFQSGSSIKGRTGVSKFADQKLKKTLHLAAVSTCKKNPEYKNYYERKLKEGKHPMSILNAIRNKILHRVIAVVKRGYPYIHFEQNLT